jgi:hypothetical protein
MLKISRKTAKPVLVPDLICECIPNSKVVHGQSIKGCDHRVNALLRSLSEYWQKMK